jgi:hypothetical protein
VWGGGERDNGTGETKQRFVSATKEEPRPLHIIALLSSSARPKVKKKENEIRKSTESDKYTLKQKEKKRVFV